MLGEEDAAVLISHLPPSGWSDVARTRDLDQLEQRLITRIDARFEVQDARIDARFAELGERVQRELRRATLLHLTIAIAIVTLGVTLSQRAAP